MSKISMFGVSASGKTCFLYAMSQVLRNGVKCGDNLVGMISNRLQQQMKLDDGYLKLINKQWPKPTDTSKTITESFDFSVSMRCNGHFDKVIDSLIIQDYRGGILEDMTEEGEENLDRLLDTFRGSSAIIFIIDGKTLIDAMDPDNRDVSHRDNTNAEEQFLARTKIQFVENIFMEYKRVEDGIPPILIAISKGDVFASEFERENGIRYIKEKLPSIFAIGSKLWAGITTMSLGENLNKDNNGNLTGTLMLDLEHNIHVPIIFGIYADLLYEYERENNPADKNGLSELLQTLREMFADKVQLFKNGGRTYLV